jgi:tetratricopeptide (TPR) repeat protein
MPELNSAVAARIDAIAEQGTSLADRGDYDAAVRQYVNALELLPEPITQWDEATWLLTAIGDVQFLAGRFEEARLALSDCMHCPGAIGNPFIHLRLGEAQFELGDLPRAADELTRAYMGAGDEIFSQESPKYFAFLKTKIRT